MDWAGRHPWVTAGLALIIGVALAIPVVAYVIVPQFARSTLVEPPPTATAATSSAPGAPGVPSATPAPPTTLAQGELVRISVADYGSGTVRVLQVGTDRVLRFESVDIAGAPDMYVYLSDRDDGKPGTYVDLGKLKATNGSFNYAVPASVELGAIRSVVVWCRQFSVTVTYAVLGR